jgi:hypothetical protein
VVWIGCHNPTLAFLLGVIGPAVGDILPGLRSGDRVMASEDGVVHLPAAR